jgi:hypothetical protein
MRKFYILNPGIAYDKRIVSKALKLAVEEQFTAMPPFRIVYELSLAANSYDLAVDFKFDASSLANEISYVLNHYHFLTELFADMIVNLRLETEVPDCIIKKARQIKANDYAAEHMYLD